MDIDRVSQYLTGMSYGKSGESGLTRRSYPFVAISRQAGAGGHSLTEALLREMEKRSDRLLFRGWQVFDEEICRKIADNPKLRVLMDSLLNEKFRTGIGDVLAHAIAGSSHQDVVTREIFRIVRGAAALGKSIIVGRAAASLMRHHPLGVFVRLIAPEDQRISSMRKRLDTGKEAAGKRVQERDADRARFVRYYFGQDIDDPLLYDCVWNTGSVPIDAVARAVIGLIEARADAGDKKAEGPVLAERLRPFGS